MRLSRTVPAGTPDDELEPLREELWRQATGQGVKAESLWACYYSRDDGSVEVVVAERPAPWD